MRKKVHGAWKTKQFVEPKPVSVPGEIRRIIRISELERDTRILVGIAGAQGWRDFKWGFHFKEDIVARPPDSETYFVLRLVNCVRSLAKTEEGELAARIYLASIGETLD